MPFPKINVEISSEIKDILYSFPVSVVQLPPTTVTSIPKDVNLSKRNESPLLELPPLKVIVSPSVNPCSERSTSGVIKASLA